MSDASGIEYMFFYVLTIALKVLPILLLNKFFIKSSLSKKGSLATAACVYFMYAFFDIILYDRSGYMVNLIVAYITYKALVVKSDIPNIVKKKLF